MTQVDKLEALVRKAIENGWNGKLHPSVIRTEQTFIIIKTWKGHVDNSHNNGWNFYEILFNHDFARALFGQLPTYVHTGYERYTVGKDVRSNLDPRISAKEAVKDDEFVTGAISYEAWQYHLQQAVISNDPIDYMYKAVFGKQQERKLTP